MRIINGYLSGRITHIPGTFKARPTTDLARSALFNILRNRIDFEAVSALDLFSGTGSISYEFASLGCPRILAVERDRMHCETIRKNIRSLEIESIRLMQADVFLFLRRNRESFDVVFADPPFDMPGMSELPGLLLRNPPVKPDGFVILEHGPGIRFDEYENWLETRVYGKVHFSFFKP